MTKITVSLTTTKFAYTTDVQDKLQQHQLQQSNLPICYVESFWNIFSSSSPEQLEHEMSLACKNMVKDLQVNSHLKTVMIGVNLRNPTTLLVEYQQNEEQQFSTEFFKRFDDTKTLILQFVFFNNEKIVFTLRALWVHDKWTFCDIFSSSNMTILTDKKDEQN